MVGADIYWEPQTYDDSTTCYELSNFVGTCLSNGKHTQARKMLKDENDVILGKHTLSKKLSSTTNGKDDYFKMVLKGFHNIFLSN